MCGIVGYVGNKNASEVLIYGLKSLEYRGYDSAGISFLTKNNKKEIIKSVGRVSNLEDKIKNIDETHMGIAHTRWATHGKVNETNSHPHHAGKVTLVHNGIIENFRELKSKLKNHKFYSETDSEVAAAVINEHYKDNPLKAINEGCKQFKGSFALLIMFDNNEKLYAIRKGSPLIVGIGTNENFVASDISAILKYTNKYIDMDEYEIYEISNSEIKVYNQNLEEIKKEILTAEWDLESSQKNGYEHFMLKEINEQPTLIDKIKAKYFDENKIVDCIDLTKYERIDIVACGSAYHAGLIGKSLFEKFNKSKTYMTIEVASEYRYKNHNFDNKVLVIVISQSGETADTLAALRMANENNVDTLAIVNVVSSSIAKEAKYVMPMLAGPEIAVATTKGYFTQVLNMSILIMNALNLKLNDYVNELEKLNKKIESIINYSNYENIAKDIFEKEHMYFIGRGIDYSLCLEASLKLKEISYIHSDTYQAGELKHGPIALIENNTIVFVLITDENLKDKTISNAIEAKSRGANLILVTTENMDIDESLFIHTIRVPKTNDFYQPLVNIIPFQLISYYVSKLRGCDIDKPKNLAKSVTVE